MGSKSMTSFSRANVTVPPAFDGLLAAWAGAACVGAACAGAAGADVGFAAGALVAAVVGAWAFPPHATISPTAPALNRLVKNSRRVLMCDPFRQLATDSGDRRIGQTICQSS